jgi:AraC family transcriptional regulator
VTGEALQAYHDRMRRVLDHIDAHLDADLSVERLSGVAAFSRFHFHRQFSALFGLSVGRYVQQARLKRAAHRLAFRTDPITRIALDGGYEPEAFSRAFRQLTGQTPSEFRRQPSWRPWQEAYGPFEQARSLIMSNPTDDQVALVDFPETPVAVLTHRGDPAADGDTIRRFIAWRRRVGLSPKLSATFNIFHDDPDTTPPEAYRLDLCAATRAPIAPNDEGVVAGVIPAGRCARLRVIGGGERLRPAALWLYGDWLPRSGEEPRDFPVFAQRVSFFPDVAEGEAVTDVFLPLR